MRKSEVQMMVVITSRTDNTFTLQYELQITYEAVLLFPFNEALLT